MSIHAGLPSTGGTQPQPAKLKGATQVPPGAEALDMPLHPHCRAMEAGRTAAALSQQSLVEGLRGEDCRRGTLFQYKQERLTEVEGKNL